ncbi:MAG: GNAT family N-acetyltransferase [Pseudomonadota bacterium]
MTAAPYRLDPEPPSVEEYLRLRADGGLSPFSPEAAAKALPRSLIAVTIRQDGMAVGMGRAVGDGGCFVQIVDIVVAADHRGHGLGVRIMEHLLARLRQILPVTAHVSMLADPPADRLYARFGFAPTAPRSIGMALRL